MKASDTRETDFVVIGCGIAGLRAAIELAPAGEVLVLSKAQLTESATQYAQGGIAAALSDEDEISLHHQDTLRAGDGLNCEEAVGIMVEEGPRYIQQLIEWGTEFDREESRLAFRREGAHSRSRVLHAQGDSTGREILRVLFARAHDLIELLPYVFTTDLLVERDRVCGVRFLDERTQQVGEIRAQAVLLATGGLGQVYSETTNPGVATGDGVAIAYRAGAALRDMEFIQFHPTALYIKGAPRFLLSEALRGEGGCLRTLELDRFMPRYHEDADLAPRDVLSHAIATELQRTSSEFVYLDMTALDPERIRTLFPRIHGTCLEYNIDISTDLVPVRPAAHYAMGGIATDLDGHTSLPGLYAAGEVACNGVHGANRLASNSLLEGLVFGARSGRVMARGQTAQKRAPPSGKRDRRGSQGSTGTETADMPTARPMPPAVVKRVEKIRRGMWENVGIIRTASQLEAAMDALARPGKSLPASPTRADYEEANLRTVAEVITRCALAREESRGAHYRADFPIRLDEQWGKHSRLVRAGEVTFE